MKFYWYSSIDDSDDILICYAITIISIICLWKIFKKAGYKGWEAIIPIYNTIILFKVAGLDPFEIVLLLIPFANIYITFKLYIELAHKFGKSTSFGVATLLCPFIGLPILAFANNSYFKQVTYNQNMYNNQETIQKQNNFCTNCGAQLNNTDAFCTVCGKKR